MRDFKLDWGRNSRSSSGCWDGAHGYALRGSNIYVCDGFGQGISGFGVPVLHRISCGAGEHLCLSGEGESRGCNDNDFRDYEVEWRGQ